MIEKMKFACCAKCKRKSNQYMDNMKGTRVSNSRYHYVMVAVTLAVVATFFIQDVAEDGHQFVYYTPNREHFDRPPSIFLSALEFGQEDIKEQKQEMASEMDYACEATANDVVFSFQYVRSKITNQTYNDHIFMLCPSHQAFGNGEAVFQSPEQIVCTEEYAGELRKKRRSADVTIKAIDIKRWKPVQYDSRDEQEACTIGHALDMLNKVW